RTPVEKELARIWADVLGLERVGITDNFFESGGDSILSIQIVSRARDAGLSLTPKHLFQHQTISELAAVTTISREGAAEEEAVEGFIPLTPIQRWFFEQELPEPHHYNQAVMLELRSPADAGLLEKSLERLVEHHDALRLRFEREGRGWVFFFQAEDGIRDKLVTGVQTCALPISPVEPPAVAIEVFPPVVESASTLVPPTHACAVPVIA